MSPRLFKSSQSGHSDVIYLQAELSYNCCVFLGLCEEIGAINAASYISEHILLRKLILFFKWTITDLFFFIFVLITVKMLIALFFSEDWIRTADLSAN